MSSGASGSDEKISASKCLPHTQIQPLDSEQKFNTTHDLSSRGATGSDRNIDQTRLDPTAGNRGQYQHPEPHAESGGSVGRDETIQAAKVDPLVSQAQSGETASTATRKNPGLDDEVVDAGRVAPMGEVREEMGSAFAPKFGCAHVIATAEVTLQISQMAVNNHPLLNRFNAAPYFAACLDARVAHDLRVTPQDMTSSSPLNPWATPLDPHPTWTDHAAFPTDDDQLSPSVRRPLSGPGASRQTRRLQLRNAGFRGSAVPTRKVTPKSVSNSTASDNVVSGSDIENVAPILGSASAHEGSLKVQRNRRGGNSPAAVLREIGSVNGGASYSTRSTGKKKKARVSSGMRDLFTAPTPQDTVDTYSDALSPPISTSTRALKPRSVRSKAKMNNKRRSVSGEARLYIEHLETELASAQTQLQAINSPSVTREQSSKMRHLNAEAKQLQDEVAEWEAKYDDRIQEMADEHREVENTLRAHVRRLEEEAEEYRYRLSELEEGIEEARVAAEAAEHANVNLEKRLEIMSELLATSPAKIDLHTETPCREGRIRKRPRSMLPRFPTAGVLTSPERQGGDGSVGRRTQPPSPVLAYTPSWQKDQYSRQEELRRRSSHTASDAGALSDTDSARSAWVEDGDSMTAPTELPPSSTTTEHPPAFNPWTLQAINMSQARSRPARRMRRFGAGAHGMKPLILPSATGWQTETLTAPPLERSETTPTFSFRSKEAEDVMANHGASPDDLLAVRRRASTDADVGTFERLVSNPFLLPPSGPEQVERDDLTPVKGLEASLFSVGEADLSRTDTTAKDHSSLGSNAGRNLVDELYAVRTNESSSSWEDLTSHGVAVESGDRSTEGRHGREDCTVLVTRPSTPSDGLPPSFICGTPQSLATTNIAGAAQLSLWTRLRLLFGDLYRSPMILVRNLVQTAQSRMYIAAPLRSVQWWLVGVLLGPMARRRLLSSHGHRCCTVDDKQEEEDDNDAEVVASQRPLLSHRSPSHGAESAQEEHDEGLEYGTIQTPPPSSPGPRSKSGTMSGKGKKRIQSVAMAQRRCAHCERGHPYWTRHSPWMWLKFSITLAFAVGVAFKDGPASLLKASCGCSQTHMRSASGATRRTVKDRSDSRGV
ncbi:hypothetical protein KC361_g4571 [Hortaea werneckii]|nr:hypothetical protein KC361_g4571 [Hortaea werneckii]